MSVSSVSGTTCSQSDPTGYEISLRTHIKYQPVLEGALGVGADSRAEDKADAPTSMRAVTGSGARLDQLNDDEKRQVEELKQRDREVRQHEQAHLAAAGPHARSGARYHYVTGPDGQRYAIGGEVRIDTSGVPGDPAATIRKARLVRAAALAPANPSAQDRAVAAEAQRMESKAVEELAGQQTGEASGDAGAGRLVLGTATPFAVLSGASLQTPQSDAALLRCPHCSGSVYAHKSL